MNLETKVDDLREVLARVENKLDQIIEQQNGIPRLAAKFDKKKSAEDRMLDDMEDLVRYSLHHHPRSSFKDGV